MANHPSSLCLINTSSFTFPYPVVEQVKPKKCNHRKTVKVKEPFASYSACQLFNKSPKRAGLSTSDLMFNGYLNSEEKGIGRNGYSTRNDSFPDGFIDDGCSNNVLVTCYSFGEFVR